MPTERRQPGTPNRQVRSARTGRQANKTIPRVTHAPADLSRENQTRAFRLGLLVGFAAAALAASLVLWLWAVPTVDGAVEAAKAAVA